jgi:type IX secretion system substrate protein/receptor L domain-containing protein
MKPFLFFISFILIANAIHGQVIQPCLTDGIVLSTQAQINNFPVDYPDCNTIQGNVTISGNDIVNLSGLSQIQTIKGNLEISDNALLERLTGIEQLDSIYGTFNIVRNPSIQIIDALDSLKYVGLSCSFSFNQNLTTIESLDHLDYLGGSLRFIQNDALSSISGFQKIQEIKGNLSIAMNPVLTSINSLSVDSISGQCFITGSGLDNLLWLSDLRIIGISFFIEDNSNLTSLSGLSALQSIEGGLSISSNTLLANGTGLENLESIGYDLIIQQNPLLNGLQFAKNLDIIPGRLLIQGNDVLNNLTGLDSIRIIEGDVLIRNNAKLQSLQGLDSLGIIRGAIMLRDNEVLEDIDAFSQISPVEVTDVTIENSPMLSECAVESICDFLSAGGDALFANNATGCNSTDEVNAACLVGLHNAEFSSEMSISPNPTSGLINLQFAGSGNGLIRVFDSQGHEIIKIPEDNSSIDLSAVQPGLYFLVLENSQQRFSARVLKI